MTTRSYTLPLYPHHVSGSSRAKRASRLPRDERALPAACASPELTPERPGASCNPGGSQCMRYVSSRALRYSPLPREPLPLPSSPPVSPSSPPCPAPPVQRQALSLCCCSLASFARLPFRKVIALRERFLTGSAFLMPKRRSRSSPPSGSAFCKSISCPVRSKKLALIACPLRPSSAPAKFVAKDLRTSRRTSL